MNGTFNGYIKFKNTTTWNFATSIRQATPEMIFYVTPWNKSVLEPDAYLLYWNRTNTPKEGGRNWGISRQLLRNEFDRGNIEILRNIE